MANPSTKYQVETTIRVGKRLNIYSKKKTKLGLRSTINYQKRGIDHQPERAILGCESHADSFYGESKHIHKLRSGESTKGFGLGLVKLKVLLFLPANVLVIILPCGLSLFAPSIFIHGI